MGTQEELAQLVYQLRDSGVDLGSFSVVPQGVFFPSYKSAQIVAKKYNRDLVRVDGQVSGWLVKDRDPETS